MKLSKKTYLDNYKAMGIEPHFYISESYISQDTINVISRGNLIWLEEDGFCLFHPIDLNGAIIKTFDKKIWVTNIRPIEFNDKFKFFDYNYLYNAKSFLSIEGKKWEVFRKNIRKFEKRNVTKGINYTIARDHNQINKLLLGWLTSKGDLLQDGDYIVKCILDTPKKDYIKFLYADGRLVGINYADENWKYINYRYIICEKIPYLDEFCRYKFYTDPDIIGKDKLINDGGVLDSPGLKKFKDRLNPVKINKLYTQIK